MLAENSLAGRVEERCRQLGKTVAAVLARAGVSAYYLRTTSKHGRRYDRLEKIAAELDWPVSRLMGEPLPVGRIDPDLLRLALQVARRALARPAPEDAALEIEVVVIVYDWLVDRQVEGKPVPGDDEAAFGLLEAVLAAYVKGRLPRASSERGGRERNTEVAA